MMMMNGKKHETTGSLLAKRSLAFVWLVVLFQCAHGFQRSAIAPSKPTHHRTSQRNYNQKSSIARTTSLGSAVLPTDLVLPTPVLLSSLGSPVGAVVVLASVILIHEAGHYLAARSLGISVEEFSVGIGPRVLGFKAFGDEFNLRALPLGGYVRFPENYNSTQVMELQNIEVMNQQIKEEQDEKDNSALWSLINVVTFGRLERKRQEEEALKEKKAQEAKEAAKTGKWWNSIFGPNSKSTLEPEVERKPKRFEIEYYDDPDLLQNRPWPQRALVLSGGVVFNLLLAFCIFFGEIHIGNGMPKPVFEQGAVVSSLPKANAASNGLLEPGDIIVGVNGSPLSLSKVTSATAAQKGIADFIHQIRDTPDGGSLELSVVKPNTQAPTKVVLQPKRLVDDFGQAGPQSIGVLLRPNFIKRETIRTDSVPEAVSLAALSVVDLTVETANGLLTFFGQIASGQGAPPGKSVSGPIGLIRTGSSVVSTSDLTAILTFAAAISVNLAVVNSLPLPALDGGQLVFVISEAITGRKVDQRFQEGVTSVAILFLLLLTVGTAIGDVESIFLR